MKLLMQWKRLVSIYGGGSRRCLLIAMAAVLGTPASGQAQELDSSHLAQHASLDSQARLQGRTSRHAASKYPIVLHHGMLGSDRILFSDYFYRVPRLLGQRSGQKIFVTKVSPANSIAYRAKQLAHQIDEILERTGAEKVNIIGHSMAGLDARYMISTMGYGDRVASLVTIGTPHRGSEIADIALKLIGGNDKRAMAAFEKIIGFDTSTTETDDGWPIDVKATLWNLTTEYTTKYFNPSNPDDPQVYYQSWAGRTSLTGITTGDIVEPLFFAPYLILKRAAGANDGLVSVKSARWGEFGGIIPADHLDMIGQLFGTTSPFFNHLAFYDAIVDKLVRKGF